MESVLVPRLMSGGAFTLDDHLHPIRAAGASRLLRKPTGMDGVLSAVRIDGLRWVSIHPLVSYAEALGFARGELMPAEVLARHPVHRQTQQRIGALLDVLEAFDHGERRRPGVCRALLDHLQSTLGHEQAVIVRSIVLELRKALQHDDEAAGLLLKDRLSRLAKFSGEGSHLVRFDEMYGTWLKQFPASH